MVLTLLGDRDVSDDFDDFDFRKIKNIKIIGNISTPQKCKNPIFVIFANRGNTQLDAKKARLSKDCLIAEIFSTQLYMQILVWILVLVDTYSLYTPNYMTSAKYRGTEVHYYLFGTTTTLGGLSDGARMKQGWNIHLYLLETRYRDFLDFEHFRYRIYWDFKGFTVYLKPDIWISDFTCF